MSKNYSHLYNLNEGAGFLKVQLFYSLISSLKTGSSDFTFYPLVTEPVHSYAISTPRGAYSPAAVSAHWTYRTHCHLCPTRYSFHLSQVKHLRVKFLTQGHTILTMSQDWEGRNMYQAGLETARQAATSAERHALTIALWPSLMKHMQIFLMVVDE